MNDGTVTVLMNSCGGKPLNAPNDVTVHSDGSVWLTDPGWGIEGNYEGDKAVKENSPLRLPRRCRHRGGVTHQ
jgi:gluconolactonase